MKGGSTTLQDPKFVPFLRGSQKQDLQHLGKRRGRV